MRNALILTSSFGMTKIALTGLDSRTAHADNIRRMSTRNTYRSRATFE